MTSVRGPGDRRDRQGSGDALRAGEVHPKTGETITVRSLRPIPHTLKCSAISDLSAWYNCYISTLYEIVLAKNTELGLWQFGANIRHQNIRRRAIRAETSGRTLQNTAIVHIMFQNLSDFAASGQPGLFEPTRSNSRNGVPKFAGIDYDILTIIDTE